MWLVGAVSALLTLGFWVLWSRWPRRLTRPAGSAAEEAFRRHPAGRALYAAADDRMSPAGSPISGDWAVPRGPDDDPEFLSQLDRAIRRDREPGTED
ncbi:MAG TPA: hypothetical protein VMV92_37765 [Streptosporangiaceae bacterium]|nr:hypothetical protein [Streptosporangiaceae bacterium]